jgi:hypothetical protein
MVQGWQVHTFEVHAEGALFPMVYGVNVNGPPFEHKGGVTVQTDSYAATMNNAARALGWQS